MVESKAVRRTLALLAVLALAVAACTAPSENTAIPSTTAPELGIPEQAAELVAQVQGDLAERLDATAEEISVVEVNAVEWPDKGLGCPASGQSYDQVITPGYEIVLEVDGATFAYHSGPDSFVLCEDGGAGAETPSAGQAPEEEEEEDGVLTTLLELARKDLSSRLGVPEHSIVVEMAEAVEWNDSSLGCPQPGMSYLTVITPGYSILLWAEDQIYEYHTDMEEILFCGTPSREEPADGSMEAKLRSDLAQRLGIEEDGITVVSVTHVEWPDSGLGCPQPGMSYLQVITPGLKVVLEALGQEYVYHSGPDTFVLCEEPSSSGPVARERPTESARLEPEVERLVALAMEDLGEWLGFPLDEISLTSVEAVQWRDSSLGCPEPGMAYLTVITPGYLILLEVDGETYEYHTDTNRVVYCEDPQPPLENP